jgi:hypothetical protein
VKRFLEIFSDDYDQTQVPPHTRVDPAIVRALTLALRDDDKGIREQSALALGMLGARASLKELGDALADTETGVRGAAALAIAKLGGQEHGRALVALLADGSMSVRNRVLHALGVLRVKEAGPALREMFEANRRKELGQRTLQALSRVADPAQADLFRELVQDADPERKRLAVEGLARVSDERLLPAFKRTSSARKATSCAWPTASPSPCSATAPSWTASCSTCRRRRSAAAAGSTCWSSAPACSVSCTPT